MDRIELIFRQFLRHLQDRASFLKISDFSYMSFRFSIEFRHVVQGRDHHPRGYPDPIHHPKSAEKIEKFARAKILRCLRLEMTDRI